MIIYNDDNDAYSYLEKYLQKNYYSKIFVLCDINTKRYCYPILKKKIKFDKNKINIIQIDDGEINKNLQISEYIWQQLLKKGCDRSSLLINLGGGVITDIGGFVASIFNRGIKFINIPTTLLAMVDASTGGKTGIDFLGFKNMLGTFSFPEITLIDINFLKTLSKQHLKSGFAEMLKHGLIKDKQHWNDLIENGIHIGYRLIKKSVEIKANIVNADPFESGERKLLNFGHTIGHALESFSLINDKNSLTHGESVAIGIIIECYISFFMDKLNYESLYHIVESMIKFFELYEISPPYFSEILEFMKKDKKNINEKFKFVILNDIGKAEYNIEVNNEIILKSLNFYNKLRT